MSVLKSWEFVERSRRGIGLSVPPTYKVLDSNICALVYGGERHKPGTEKRSNSVHKYIYTIKFRQLLYIFLLPKRGQIALYPAMKTKKPHEDCYVWKLFQFGFPVFQSEKVLVRGGWREQSRTTVNAIVWGLKNQSSWIKMKIAATKSGCSVRKFGLPPSALPGESALGGKGGGEKTKWEHP